MLVYGRNVAKDIIKKNKKVRKVILQENFDDKEINSLLENGKFDISFLTKNKMDNLSNGNHQGIILDIPDYKYKQLPEIMRNNPRFFVILDHLEDPHNLGAIIRTCEAAGVDAILIPKDRQVQINSTVMKASVGTLDNVDIVSVSNIVNAINQLKANGFWIVGTSLDCECDYRTVNYDGKIALVIGNENSGISRLVEKSCDFVVKIPMYGMTNSLNASVAAGIMIYEIIRNRK